MEFLNPPLIGDDENLTALLWRVNIVNHSFVRLFYLLDVKGFGRGDGVSDYLFLKFVLKTFPQIFSSKLVRFQTDRGHESSNAS